MRVGEGRPEGCGGERMPLVPLEGGLCRRISACVQVVYHLSLCCGSGGKGGKGCRGDVECTPVQSKDELKQDIHTS